jgi:hypothetical protein
MMMFMTYGHTFEFAVSNKPEREMWWVPADNPNRHEDFGGVRAADFALRQLDLVATGFFLTLGVGVAYLLRSRQERHGFTAAQLIKFFALRALVLTLFDVGLSLALTLITQRLVIFFQVMISLAANMFLVGCYGIADSALVRLSRRRRWPIEWPTHVVGALLSALIFVVTQATIPDPTTKDEMLKLSPAVAVWWALAHPTVMVSFPIFPWTPLTLFGLSLGKVCMSREQPRSPGDGDAIAESGAATDQTSLLSSGKGGQVADDDAETGWSPSPSKCASCQSSFSSFWPLYVAGAIGAVLFPVLRSLFLFADVNIGNIRPMLRGDEGGEVDFFVFFSTSKYPPSFVFLCWSVALTALAVFIFDRFGVPRMHRWFMRPFAVFGAVPFFFYVTHWVLVAAITGPGGVNVDVFPPYVAVYVLFVLLGMFPLCKKFAEFKQSKPPHSLWRLC